MGVFREGEGGLVVGLGLSTNHTHPPTSFEWGGWVGAEGGRLTRLSEWVVWVGVYMDEVGVSG